MTTKLGSVVATFSGTFSVTKFDFNELATPVSVTGILNGVVTFLDHEIESIRVIDHVVTTTATLKKGLGISAASSVYHLAAASSRIPLLNLSPFSLYPLELLADLNEIVLDVTPHTGANSLLGTLLGALTGVSLPQPLAQASLPDRALDLPAA
ncbi:MAG TPA: hypothetical protein VM166_02600 [Gemmatimonadaceae bacterium]|nr:hypothetical protein [Gemmatimonadaceae bacterium]